MKRVALLTLALSPLAVLMAAADGLACAAALAAYAIALRESCRRIPAVRKAFTDYFRAVERWEGATDRTIKCRWGKRPNRSDTGNGTK